MEGNLKSIVFKPHPSIVWRMVCILLILISLLRNYFKPVDQTDYSQKQTQGQIVSNIKPVGLLNQFYIETQVGSKIKVTSRSGSEFDYGDVVLFQCQKFNQTNYSSWQGECWWPKLSLFKKSDNYWFKYFQTVRRVGYDYLSQYLIEPYLSLTVGLLWGDDSNLPADIKNSFRVVGLSHILAASGYNLMVLSSWLFFILTFIGCHRRLAAWLVIAGVMFFIFLAGAEPAVVRAGLMTAVVIVVRFFGQKVDNLNLLLGTAAIMLIIKPILVGNIGWQLSFGAMVGLMYILPKLKERWERWPEFFGIKETVSQTLSANLATWPIILWHFGTMSIISPLANVLAAPVVDLSFVLTAPIFVFGFWPLLGQLLAWGWQICLWGLVEVVYGLSLVPGASFTISKLYFFILCPIYLWLIWRLLSYEKKIKK